MKISAVYRKPMNWDAKITQTPKYGYMDKDSLHFKHETNAIFMFKVLMQFRLTK